MPTPKKAILIGVKNTNMANEYITIRNFTRADVIKAKVDSNGESATNPSDYGYDDWDNEDSVLIESQGRIIFTSTQTITKGGINYTSTVSSADDSPAVSL